MFYWQTAAWCSRSMRLDALCVCGIVMVICRPRVSCVVCEAWNFIYVCMVFVWQLCHADGFLFLFWELRKTVAISGLQFSSDFGDLKPILAELTSGRQIAGSHRSVLQGPRDGRLARRSCWALRVTCRVACRGRGKRGPKTLFRTSALLQASASAPKRKRVPTPK